MYQQQRQPFKQIFPADCVLHAHLDLACAFMYRKHVMCTWQAFNPGGDWAIPTFPANHVITLTYTLVTHLQVRGSMWRVTCTWQALDTSGDSTGQGCTSSPHSCRGDLPGLQDAHKGGGHQSHLPVDIGYLQPAINLVGHLHLQGRLCL